MLGLKQSASGKKEKDYTNRNLSKIIYNKQ